MPAAPATDVRPAPAGPDGNGPAGPPAGRWARLLREFTHGKVGFTLGFSITVAVVLNPIFAPPFTVVLGRSITVGLVLLLAYVLAGQWHQRWVPRWLAQALAVALAAPLATLGAYLVSTGGDFIAFVQHPARVAGFVWISGSALALGLVLALGALVRDREAAVREREAQARSLQLQFQLERAELERQAVDARLALLTAQIEPHFLFNTLANVQALVETGSPRAAEVLRSLVAYLRAALPRLHEGGLPTLANEVRLVQAYLELMHLRMPDRLQFRVDVASEILGLRFAPMALLTLVENAVRHGVDPSETGGHIDVGGRAEGTHGLRLWVADTGVGLSGHGEQGTGLANLRERLLTLYGPHARLELSEHTPRGVRAEIIVPDVRGPAAPVAEPR